MDATYAPNEFVASDGTTVTGWDPEVAQALASVLGLKVKLVNATFATIILGIQSGKYDFSLSSLTDTKERQKVVDFVTYFTAGTSFYAKTSGGPTTSSLADLCGHSVGVETGTTQADAAKAQSAKCKSAGKAGVKVATYPDQSAANLAISSGRQQVGTADSPVAAASPSSRTASSGDGRVVHNAPYGIAIPKGNGMTKPILDALKELISNGTYMTILQKYGVQAGAIKNPTINGATS